jgi:hypothetical protein
MSRRAVFTVTVARTNITAPLLPVLISLTVSDKAGTHADTATLEIDDTDGRIVLSDLGDVTAARENLGLGSMATQAADNVAITGGSFDDIALDGGTF